MNATIQAGRELDALVAEKVMGWTDWKHGELGETSGGNPYCVRCNEIGHWSDRIFSNEKCCPRYSDDIAAAWSVVEKIVKPDECNFGIAIEWCCENYEDKFMVNIRTVTGTPPYEEMNDAFVIVTADTAPLAICLAALQWAESKND